MTEEQINLDDIKEKMIDPDQYKYIKVLGSGKFGEVYKVKDELNNYYALKRINEFDELKFNREVYILSLLDHPCVLSLIGFSKPQDEKKATIVTQLLSNKDLKEIVLENPPDWNAAKQMINIYGIAKGMEYCHSQNILHRDLKPENILLNSRYEPHIADFGLSKVTDISSLLIQSNVTGTPTFTAPEMLDYDNCNEKMDVYSYAIIIYFIFTGTTPFSEEKNLSLFKNLVTSSALEDYKMPDEIPYLYQSLISACGMKNPMDRPDFETIVNELSNPENYLEGIDVDEFEEYKKRVDNGIRLKEVFDDEDEQIDVKLNDEENNENELVNNEENRNEEENKENELVSNEEENKENELVNNEEENKENELVNNEEENKENELVNNEEENKENELVNNEETRNDEEKKENELVSNEENVNEEENKENELVNNEESEQKVFDEEDQKANEDTEDKNDKSAIQEENKENEEPKEQVEQEIKENVDQEEVNKENVISEEFNDEKVEDFHNTKDNSEFDSPIINEEIDTVKSRSINLEEMIENQELNEDPSQLEPDRNSENNDKEKLIPHSFEFDQPDQTKSIPSESLQIITSCISSRDAKCDQNHKESMNSMAKILNETDNDNALKLLKNAAKKGDVKAQKILARKFSLENDTENTHLYMLMLLKSGNCVIPTEYAVNLYKKGKFSQAFYFFEKIAEINHPIAIYFVGVMKFYGHGCMKNRDEAYDIMKKLSKNGIERASDFIENNFEQEDVLSSI